MSNEEEAKTSESGIRINFRVPARLPSVYASHVFVQDTEEEVVLSFFELMHPLLPEGNTEEERAKNLKKLQETGVMAECVSRVTIARHRLPLFAKILNDVSQRFLTEMEGFEKQYAPDQPDNREAK